MANQLSSETIKKKKNPYLHNYKENFVLLIVIFSVENYYFIFEIIKYILVKQ